MVLANNSLIAYGNSVIRLETSNILLRVSELKNITRINIIDLREEDILIGYD